MFLAFFSKIAMSWLLFVLLFVTVFYFMVT